MQNEKVDPRKRKNQDEQEGRLRYEGDLPFDEPLADGEPIIEVSLEELYDEELNDPERDLAIEELIDTQHTSGSTYNPREAQEQGLVYTPPDDPPVIPSDSPEGAEIGIGFAQSMEEANPDEEVLPSRVDNNDLDLEDNIVTALRYNSETTNLSRDIQVRVWNGIVHLYGTVTDLQDTDLVEEIVRGLEGVVDVVNNLEVAAIQ
ncbi:MAG: BON domain-containing protein [Caldilineaceae bacterium]|nr:BON domain-containing protein [Caldilineaceae bacterium]